MGKADAKQFPNGESPCQVEAADLPEGLSSIPARLLKME
jgi:hypothetical protein